MVAGPKHQGREAEGRRSLQGATVQVPNSQTESKFFHSKFYSPRPNRNFSRGSSRDTDRIEIFSLSFSLRRLSNAQEEKQQRSHRERQGLTRWRLGTCRGQRLSVVSHKQSVEGASGATLLLSCIETTVCCSRVSKLLLLYCCCSRVWLTVCCCTTVCYSRVLLYCCCVLYRSVPGLSLSCYLCLSCILRSGARPLLCFFLCSGVWSVCTPLLCCVRHLGASHLQFGIVRLPLCYLRGVGGWLLG